jgi:methylenetetrahydrofolate dehydrogenase (NADP+)/methenyltetrahydrofolate cyclohydrolase
MQQGATVSVINEFTKDSETLSRNADIIVSGVGKPKLITAQMVKDGAVVIDLGYENEAGKVVGDVDFEPVSKKVSFITPVPGGVGPIVIAAVLKNLVTLSLSS